METIEVKNPATGEILYTLSECPEEEVQASFERARDAYEVVRKMTVRERVEEAGKLRRYMVEHKERMVEQICRETGKSRTDALMAEVYSSLDMIRYYEKNAERILREQKAPTPMVLFPKQSRIWFEPLGPVLVIAPWNYPFVLSFQPVISAFLAGNSVLLKSSSYTPIKGLYEDMLEGSGFVKDAIQIIYGTRATGKRLIDLKPRKVFFTGSVGAGRKIMAQAAEHLIPVELELGGKDPMLVFEDADLGRAATGARWGGMVNSGQTCTSVERIYVQEKVYEKFLALMKEKLEGLRTLEGRTGDANEPELEMGCMTTDFQVKTVTEQVEEAVQQGARLITGGRCAPGTHKYAPTLVADVTPDMRIATEESFGPVMAAAKFRTEEEAIALANASPYGLSASVWSADLDRAVRVARALETGNVSINNALATQANSALPFGGVKDSGFGRYKGTFGLYSFCNVKSVLLDKGTLGPDLHWHPYSREKYALFSRLLEAFYRDTKPAWLRLSLLVFNLMRLNRRG